MDRSRREPKLPANQGNPNHCVCFDPGCRKQHRDCTNRTPCPKQPGCEYRHPQANQSLGSSPSRSPSKVAIVSHKAQFCRCQDLNCRSEHDDCRFDLKCTRSNCFRRHPQRDSKSSGSQLTSAVILCPKVATSGIEVEDCDNFYDCMEFSCKKEHSSYRPLPCPSGLLCFSLECAELHPSSRRICDNVDDCEVFECASAHSFLRKRLCKRKECADLKCDCLHQGSRDHICELGEECLDYDCTKPHPPARAQECRYNLQCRNADCAKLHSFKRVVCEDDDCKSDTCVFHQQRVRSSSRSPPPTRAPPPTRSQPLKTFEERSRADLPILAARESFLSALLAQKVLVVTAETGSGKSTQLPQYAAEDPRLVGSISVPRFNGAPGLVVCTQPRAFAAISLANRVAEEFDGSTPGRSVGYRAASRKTPGSSIWYTTDAALIRELQVSPTLDHISVLMIDEAHERSLNTDIVLGIAKQVLAMRPNDFYVVIASATIDPTKFLQYFFPVGKIPLPLEVRGRPYDVTLEYLPPPAGITERDLVKSHVVPTTLKILQQHPQGHTLVFLPGQGEIEQAMKEFSAKVESDDFVVYPLYGSLPPEEQEKVMNFDSDASQSGKRMIVFTTNVAETSLTVPGVKVVIDSGLAKEARFDREQRITVIELVKISKSSAKQRMGRAGRLSEGHCVRLFAESDLTRESIEPEIHRAALDEVVLQLVRASLDPLSFNFIDAPDRMSLEASVALLVELGCIVDGVLSQKGMLFSDLPFDPRFSAFLLHAHEKFNRLELAVSVASVLVAPGEIFFMGSKNDRLKIKEVISVGASKYDSDLLYRVDIYHAWRDHSIASETGICPTCSKKGKPLTSCRPCRVKYAITKNLNNKVLEFVLQTEQQSLTTISTSFYIQTVHPKISTDSSSMVVSACLLQAFPEYLSSMLMDNNPTEGIRLMKADERAYIQDTSALIAREKSNPIEFVIAMSVTKLSSGMCFADKLHPIPISMIDIAKIEKSWKLQLAYSELNVSKSFISRALVQFLDPSLKKWCVFDYDASTCQLKVYTRPDHVSLVRIEADKIVKEYRNSLLNSESDFSMGTLRMKIISGGEIVSIEKVGAQFGFQVSSQTWKYYNDGKNWYDMISREFSELASKVKYTQAMFSQEGESDSSVLLTANSKEKAEDLKLRFESSKFNQSPLKIHEIKELSPSSNHTSQYGRQIVLTCPGEVTLQQFLTRFGPNVQVRALGVHDVSLKIVDVDPGISPEKIQQLLQEHGIRYKSLEQKHTHSRSMWGNDDDANKPVFIIKFESEYQLEEMKQLLITNLLPSLSYTKNLVDNGDISESKPKTVEIQRVVPDRKFIAEFETVDEAENFWDSVAGTKVITVGESEIKLSNFQYQVVNGNLWPDLKEILQRIQQKSDPSFLFTVKNIPRDAGKEVDVKVLIEFMNIGPRTFATIATILDPIFRPTKTFIPQGEMLNFYDDFDRSGALYELCQELGLREKLMRGRNWYLQLSGPRSQQGDFFRRIGEKLEPFQLRYSRIHLSKASSSLIRPGTNGFRQFEDLQKKSQADCKISVGRFSIDLVGKHDSPTTYEQDILKILKSLGGDIREGKRCATSTCKATNIVTEFQICGHGFCAACEEAFYRNSQPQVLVCCPQCSTPIHSKALTQMIPKESLDIMLSGPLRKFVRNHSSQLLEEFGFCLNHDCPSLMLKSQEFHECFKCKRSCCVNCSTVDEMHRDQDCAAFQRIKAAADITVFQSLESLLASKAEEFTEKKWPADFPKGLKPIRVDPNPALKSDAPSWMRFLRALKSLSICDATTLGNALQSGQAHFGWHGSAPNAITSIALDGFDPKRRSGQACGPGEYFGQTASVSHSYCKGGNQMLASIIVHGLHGPCTHHRDFCYVVDNPLDWSQSFAFPVAVVTFDGPDQPPAFKPSNPISPLEEILVGKNLTHSSGWTSPFRWHWQDDGGNMRPYLDSINNLIEKHYDAFAKDIRKHVFQTPLLTRFADDQPQTYEIDFMQQKQVNTATKDPVSIQRIRTAISFSVTTKWQVQESSSQWLELEPGLSSVLQRHFEAYCTSDGPSAVNIPVLSDLITFDFATGTRTNMKTKVTQPFKRE